MIRTSYGICCGRPIAGGRGKEENVTILDSSEPSVVAPRHDVLLRSRVNSARLELRVQTCDGCVVIGVWGELYADTVGELTRLVSGLTCEGCDHVVLDVSRLYDLDAHALAELGRLQTAMTARQGSFSLAAPRPWIRRLLEFMCRRDAFPVHSTVAGAIAQATARPAAD
jgi:anti-anti-sigma factor